MRGVHPRHTTWFLEIKTHLYSIGTSSGEA
jgi:hypothetical protein